MESNEVIREIIIGGMAAAISGFISIQVFKSKLKFKILQEERAQSIKEIYFQFHDVIGALSDLAFKIARQERYGESVEKVDAKDSLDYDNKVVALKENVKRNTIFFSDELVEEMLDKIATLQTGPSMTYLSFKQSNTQKDIATRNDYYFNVVRMLDGGILRPLEKEFKKILGNEIEETEEKIK